MSIFWSNNYIKYERNSDRNKILSFEEYLDKIRPYLKDVIDNFRKSDTSKIQSKIDSLKNSYQSTLESIKDKYLVFDYVSYCTISVMKKSAINSINKQCF